MASFSIQGMEIRKLDLKERKGSVIIKQKVYYVRNRKKLIPWRLNTELRFMILSNREVINYLRKAIESYLERVLKQGNVPYLDEKEKIRVKIIDVRYHTDMKNKLDLEVFFTFEIYKEK